MRLSYRRRLQRAGCLIGAMPCLAVMLFLLAIGPIPPPAAALIGAKPLSPGFLKGITYEAWWQGEYASAKSDKTLAEVIKPTGANWIALIIKCSQATLTSTDIHCKTDTSTPTDDDIRHVVRQAHQLGFQVMVKPHVNLDDPHLGRSEINFGQDTAAWQAWFASYTRFITHYARLAQEVGAEYFVVGTELAGTVDQTEQWRKIIGSVRQIYKGSLTYAALSYREEYRISWWDALDAIGINAYYPLTLTTIPTLAQLKLGWTPAALLLESLSKRWNRPIIFTEIGYLSVDGANRAAGYWAMDGATDVQEQADCYQAVFEVFQDKPWWQGVFWWSWSVDPNQGGPADRTYTAHNKPAGQILQRYFASQAATPAAP